MNHRHEQRLARVFVELADTLIDEFDIIEFLNMLVERCVELLDVAAAGVVLSDQQGGLRMAAASSERARLVELFAVQADDGPCLDCVRTGLPVSSANLADDGDRWPRFVLAAREAGFSATHAVPMRLRQTVIGALNLLDTESNGVDEISVNLGQALADVATIGVLQHRAIDDNAILTRQLQTALNSRIVIEQAKGVLSAHADVDMQTAFVALRGYSRSNNLRLSDVARMVAEGEADIDAIVAHKQVSPHGQALH
ncbi:transcriptional regulator [Actinosynnema sp. ALI-1.44]|uniref:GAF and ANTAR domain-containing protein n=1 Tax=Actinosynnema sp. ALI-1.44 TaxID=1933779 RepID=UPI00097BE941|nr:GAF and ANTAR domain-containing protein [Actinosynnema sp. ALI-1.44]ONI91884.1 transcriptional regulator [Actinosynnema sp. ALI-1.44]